MEIVYLFIKNHTKFKNQNLNFGSEYIFNYSEELADSTSKCNDIDFVQFLSEYLIR